MAIDNRILELVEEALYSDRTPEEVCADTPELLADVRASLDECRRVDLMFQSVFPSTPPQRILGPQSQPGAPLPAIPGYEVHAILGRGGHGIVYRVRHLKLKRVAALKMLLTGQFASPAELARFMREAEAIAALQHPNIVQIFDIGEVDGRPYFTMEFVGGGSLAQKLGGVPRPAQHCASVAQSLARAIHVAHVAGIIHRDLKPANVLLSIDGTPKISDFGLARYFEGQDDITRDAARVGTPSYMAPEQVLAKPGTVGPFADVYALGATLYELLVGRPPFRGETPLETEQQLLTQEPVPPSRLNAKVPRDLDTICLKCLQKTPERRYETAAALADDLARLLRGEPILARRTGPVERCLKWTRRRPAAATALASAAAAILLLLVAGLWLVSQHTTAAREVAQDLRDIAEAHRRSDWVAADRALDRAELRLGSTPGITDLRRGLEDARHESQLAQRLESIRMTRSMGFSSEDANRIEADFELAFREARLIDGLEPPDLVAARLRRMNIPSVLLDALCDWSSFMRDGERRRWMVAVMDSAFPDPTGWRKRAIDPEKWNDRAKVAELASNVPIDRQPVTALVNFANHMVMAEQDPVPFLLKVLAAHPDDYWVNMAMGNAMLGRGDAFNAARYYQASQALRPGTPWAHNGLGVVFLRSDKLDQAIPEFRAAVKSVPGSWELRANLSMALRFAGHAQEACEVIQEAYRIHPNADACSYLADALLDANRPDEALARFREAIALDPAKEQPRKGLFKALARAGAWEQGISALQAGLAGHEADINAWYGYPELCLFLGRDQDYRDARARLLSRFGQSTDPLICEGVGRACLLLPAQGDELQQGCAMIDRAVASERAAPSWRYPYFMVAKALADYRAGHAEAVLKIVRDPSVLGALYPFPKLLEAMALSRMGQEAEARRALAEAAIAIDWPPSSVEDREGCIYHILRREAEALILPDADAMLRGELTPRDDNERLSLTATCADRGLNAAGARLWSDCIAAQPSLLADHGYYAAVLAALAGCGKGLDARTLGEVERAELRKHAMRWLNGQLEGYERNISTMTEEDRRHVSFALRIWRTSPAFAGLRD